MTIYTLTCSFSNLKPVHCSTSVSNCCFLTCIQISQEAGQVVWYSHLLNFPQFVVIHTVKGFGIINKADVFLELFCFFYDPTDVGNLISGFFPCQHFKGIVSLSSDFHHFIWAGSFQSYCCSFEGNLSYPIPVLDNQVLLFITMWIVACLEFAQLFESVDYLASFLRFLSEFLNYFFCHSLFIKDCNYTYVRTFEFVLNVCALHSSFFPSLSSVSVLVWIIG